MGWKQPVSKAEKTNFEARRPGFEWQGVTFPSTRCCGVRTSQGELQGTEGLGRRLHAFKGLTEHLLFFKCKVKQIEMKSLILWCLFPT